MRRILILLPCAIFATATAVLYAAYIGIPNMTAKQAVAPRIDRDLYEFEFLLDELSIFYAITFALSRLLARMLLNQSAIDDIQRTSRNMRIRLQLLSGIFLFVGKLYLMSRTGWGSIESWLQIAMGLILMAVAISGLKRARNEGASISHVLFTIE